MRMFKKRVFPVVLSFSLMTGCFAGAEPEDYTEQSWEAYKSVLQENEKVLDKQGATDLEYGAALEDIQKAKDLLVPVEATKNRTLKIKAIDEAGNPVPNLLFVMETGAGFNPISLPATGTDGTSAYTMKLGTDCIQGQ